MLRGYEYIGAVTQPPLYRQILRQTHRKMFLFGIQGCKGPTCVVGHADDWSTRDGY
jgi:hypothetical protein